MPSPNAILLLDIGNTRLKWAHLADKALSGHTEASYTVPQIPKILDKRWRVLAPPGRVLISNVGKAGVMDAISQWTLENWGLQTESFDVEPEAWGVVCGYLDPETFGVDRWLTLVAAREKFKGSACVVDCGTALTIDALTSDGKHLGGLIVPGIGLMRKTLSRGTERIGKIPQGNTASDTLSAAAQNIWLGRGTREGVMAGTMWAAVAFIDRVVADLEAELPRGVTCILTGGDAQAIFPLLTCKATLEPDLVLQGLAVVAG